MGFHPIAEALTADPECFMTPSEMADKYGYKLDRHWVTTDDGYVLEIHNIPKHGSPVVFLQHGLLDSSMTWMLNKKEGLDFAISSILVSTLMSKLGVKFG